LLKKRFFPEAFFVCGVPQAAILAGHVSVSTEAAFPA